ncbi:hypothetical protein AYO41_04125 [Verrucomicrobia bacterium SCGC AG-212-E04]|nr:hypothetical protein AYO41_04125 [Verrucomicrobia bacterium SCGC AG-212-E04]
MVDTATHEEVGKLRELPASAAPTVASDVDTASESIEPWEVPVHDSGMQRKAATPDETISEMLVHQGMDEADAESRRLSEDAEGRNAR